MLEILNNPVTIALVGAVVGFLLSGVINFILQWIQDNRRFKHEREVQDARWKREDEVQQQRWAREDEVQQKQWDREDALRNYEARRQTYAEVMGATDDSAAARFKQGASVEDAREHAATTARLKGELRAIAPASVRAAGEMLLWSFQEYVGALYAPQGETEAEQKQLDLAEWRLTFMSLTQRDLGVMDEESEWVMQQELEDLQKRKSFQ